MKTLTVAHGEYAYAKRTGCDCGPCVLGQRRYDKKLRMEKHLGIERQVDAWPARRHVRALRRQDVTYQQIAVAAGLSRAHVKHLATRNRKGEIVAKIYRKTEAALLAVTWESAMQSGLVPACGVRRRIEALQYMGHSVVAIARELGVTDEAVFHLISKEKVKSSTVRKVDAVYQRLSMVQGDSERARFTAYRRDYLPPMAWEEGTLDQPWAEPDRSSVVCCIDGCPRPARKRTLCKTHHTKVGNRGGFESSERFHDLVVSMTTNSWERTYSEIAEMKEQGYNQQATAVRLGRPVSYVQKVWSQVA